jgi:hypothetical protein
MAHSDQFQHLSRCRLFGLDRKKPSRIVETALKNCHELFVTDREAGCTPRTGIRALSQR